MKKMLAAVLALLLCCSALSETVLTVSGVEITRGEADAFVAESLAAYADIAEYYADYLGVDYWALTYPDGDTVKQSVFKDMLKQLVMTALFCSMAEEKGAFLTEAENEAAAAEAAAAYGELAEPDFSLSDMTSLYEKQTLGNKVYELLLQDAVIDEAAVTATVDPDSCVARRVQFLCIPYYAYSGSEQKRREAEKTLRELSKAEDFTDLSSLQEDSKLLSGELTVSSDGSMDEKLVRAADRLRVGEVSDIIPTDFGLFVLKQTADTDTALYEQAVSEALLEARKTAFQTEYDRLYEQASYTLSEEYWSAETRLVP